MNFKRQESAPSSSELQSRSVAPAAPNEDRPQSGGLIRGSVTKVVKTHGSSWGRIRPQADLRQLFFNPAYLNAGLGFASLEVGDLVECEIHADNVNGAHAEHVVRLTQAAATGPAGP